MKNSLLHNYKHFKVAIYIDQFRKAIPKTTPKFIT